MPQFTVTAVSDEVRPVTTAKGEFKSRFWAKVQIAGPDDCWLWTAYTAPNGYGQFFVGPEQGKKAYAHRVAYELLVGPIPGGLIVDHICRVRACVNVTHLRLVTHAQNPQNLAAYGHRGSTSKYRGVSWQEESQKWLVQVTVGGRRWTVGKFVDEDEAGQAAAQFRAKHMPFSADAAQEREVA